MNCKPGDLAVIVRAMDDSHPMVQAAIEAAIGSIVRVTTLDPYFERPVWKFERELRVKTFFGTSVIHGLNDGMLQPIRGQHEPESVTQTKELEVTA